MLCKIDSKDLPILNFPNLVSKGLCNIKKLNETIYYDTNYNDGVIQSIIAILFQQYDTEFFITITIPKMSTYTELFTFPIFRYLIDICKEVEVLIDENIICGLKAKGLKPKAIEKYLELKMENRIDYCIRDLLKPYNELPSVDSNGIRIFEYKRNKSIKEINECTDYLLGNKFFLYLVSECIRNSGSFAMPLIGLTIDEIETSIYFEHMTYIWDRVCLLGSGKEWVSTHLFISGLKDEIELNLSR